MVAFRPSLDTAAGPDDPSPAGGPRSDLLVWLDAEMTGLDVDSDQLIEVALMLTTSTLSVVAVGPTVVIHQSDEVLAGMDEWNTTHHTQSGLVARVRESTLDMAAAERVLVDWLAGWVEPGSSPMCGNSIHNDRMFLRTQMPRLHDHFHYRDLDVSTLKILAQLWEPQLGRYEKAMAHRVVEDMLDSIGELRYYRHHLMRGGD